MKETPDLDEWMRDRKFLMELHLYPVSPWSTLTWNTLTCPFAVASVVGTIDALHARCGAGDQA
jgi:hypothetical protein